ncbi:replicative DNA helicase [Brevundimonas sp. Root1279]|uniref:replicative DNA helicase n=1 Tax=Brevundimonas sp. Root1279 TaxID=1736443 RepID=UPI0006FF42A1|nr:replicative DNA helicase [Brevundimonas sp. Root1279]KQW79731.1 replicative DNA helicase [Brevundimonas sp. Root1279]
MDPRDSQPALPVNIEAEQSLLGALLYDNAVFERLPEKLRGAHFYEPFHQRLFDAITAAAAGGRSADPTLLADNFASDPGFTDFGGLAYLYRLVDAAPPPSRAPEYARAVYDLAVRRDLIRIGGEIVAEAADPAMSAEEHVSKAEGALFGLAEAGEQAKGVATFAEALDGALAQAEAAYKRDGQLTGLATDLSDLDQKLGGLHPSDLLILAGRPSMGKTALATNIAFNVARSYKAVVDPETQERRTVAGGRVFFGSLEMSKEQLALRIVSDRAGVSNDKIRKGLINETEFRRLKDAQAELRDIPLHIDETGGINIARLCAKARRHARKHGLDLIVVDYLQLITTDHSKGGNRVQEVSQITGALKALAKELNVPIIALSQLSRQVESRDDKRPMLSDLRESGSIEQDADCVMFVYREEYYLSRSEPKEGTDAHMKWIEALDQCRNQAEVIVGKQRHGPIGTVRLSFDSDTTRFGNLAREQDYPRGERFSFGGDA